MRVRDLADQRGWSLATLAARLGMPKSTLYVMLRKPGWPQRAPDFYTRMAKELECKVADLLPEQMARDLLASTAPGEDEDMERRFEFPEEGQPQRYAHPITDKTVSLEAIGRIEHYVALLEDAGEVYRRRVDKIIREYKKEVADLRHELLKRIEHNDKGKKV